MAEAAEPLPEPTAGGGEHPGKRPDHREETPELTLADILHFFERYLLSIGGTAIGFTILALVVVLLLPPIYQSSVTILVMTPPLRSELKPATMSIHGYQRLLESNGVVAETRRRLVEQGILSETEPLRVGGRIESRIFVSRRAEDRELAPVIEAIARAGDPGSAAAIANTWAAVFVATSQEVIQTAMAPTIDLVDRQFSAASTDLEDLEQELDEATDRFGEQLHDASTGWDRRLSRFRQETEDLVAEYQGETRARFRAVALEHGLQTTETEAASAGPGRARPLETALAQLLVVRQQLAQTPELLSLKKAVTDEALWGVVAEGGSLAGMSQNNLTTQEVNPLFTQLSLQAAELELEIEALAEQHDADVPSLTDRLAAMEKARRAGLAKLVEARSAELSILVKRRDVDLARLKRAWETERAQLQRAVSRRQALFAELSADLNKTRLAQAQTDVADVRVVTQAQPPVGPLSKKVLFAGAAAVMVGLLLGVLVAIVREILRREAAVNRAGAMP